MNPTITAKTLQFPPLSLDDFTSDPRKSVESLLNCINAALSAHGFCSNSDEQFNGFELSVAPSWSVDEKDRNAVVVRATVIKGERDKIFGNREGAVGTGINLPIEEFKI